MNTTNLHIPSNRVRDIQRYIYTELDGMYPMGELRMFSNMLFEAILGWDTVQQLLHKDYTINQSDLLTFHWAVEDLKRYCPIQYIIGWTEFCGQRFKVTKDTLIPRPETEGLVTLIQKQVPKKESMTILDLCTGSGCIALTLERMFNGRETMGVDISNKALEVAQENGRQQHSRAQFVMCDLLKEEPLLPYDLWDIIVSNPPYVRDLEREQMQSNVLNYEPPQALFVPNDDPLLFYRIIGLYAQRHLTDNGVLAFEINEALGADTCRLLETMGYQVTLYQDFRDRDRYIIAHNFI